MISIEEVIRLQGILIENFGGTAGLRNRELLESALSRPWQTFDGKELYQNPEDKSAALAESIIISPNSALGVRNLPFGSDESHDYQTLTSRRDRQELTKKLKNNFLSGLILTLNMNDLLANTLITNHSFSIVNSAFGISNAECRINHPFLDGNKRIGYVLMRITLLESDLDIVASEDEKYNLIIEVSKGTLKFEQIRDWIKSRLVNSLPEPNL